MISELILGNKMIEENITLQEKILLFVAIIIAILDIFGKYFYDLESTDLPS